MAAFKKAILSFSKRMTKGAEVLHVETGMSNLQQGRKEPYRVEHFGFRDGVSQPYLDIGQRRPPPPGGGTPRGDGTSAPVRPGELLLGQPDEDGIVQRMPANATLRYNGTYMVFRKLAQDVVRFRDFTKATAEKTSRDASEVAAAIVGRWHDGSPLVRFPHEPGASEAGTQRLPLPDRGSKGTALPHRRPRAPLQSARYQLPRRSAAPSAVPPRHIVWRHAAARKLSGDGVERGLLFVSLQARLDHQFEFVQSNWLNRGEFSGQAGARRDPLVFPHAGRTCDEFLMPGEPAPITGLPRFVTMRGGDYFFVPSFTALKAMRDGSRVRSHGLWIGARIRHRRNRA